MSKKINIDKHMYTYIYILYIYIHQLEPHKAVAEVSKIGNL